MKSISLIVLTLIVHESIAQAEWNWPKDPEMDKIAKEKQAYYKVQMSLNNHQGSLSTLQWLYRNVPDLNPSIYIDGAKAIDALLEGTVTDERKATLEDSLLWMYDMRLRYFDDDASVLDRKAYTAFKLYYKTPSRYPMLLDLYAQAYAANGKNISDFNLTPYITLAVYYHKSNPDELNAEQLLDIYDVISGIIREKLEDGGNEERLRKEQDKADAFLGTAGNILNCRFIEEKIAPKFSTHPNDLKLAKKVFTYSLRAKCTDQPYFLRAGEVLFGQEPSFGMAKVLGDRYYAGNEYIKAMDYYTKAESLATDNDKKFEVLLGQAYVQSRLGNKAKSRSLAREALNIRPGSSDVYNFIGNLYFNSFADCKGGESIVQDRAIFLAAYEMYKKAGNISQMEASRQQFPSIEEIFSESLQEGDKITVGCWINESVTIRRR